MRKLLFLLGTILVLSSPVFAQTREITGKVTDDKGLPISNASVQERGSKRGTFTDLDGNFKLTVNANARLTVSSVGYDTKEVAVGSSSDLSVNLSTSAQSLSEVVVTGVGVATSKRKLAIAVESVSTDRVATTPSKSVDQALVGRIAGAQISSVSGAPGARAQILLRGINTLQRGTSPMILLDGVQLGATDLNSIDLTSIERVEVVQGSAAATMYGAQGANGVIQLFSKKGRAGKINIDISSSVASNKLVNIGDVHKARLHSLTTNGNNEVVGGSGDPLVFDPALSHYEENVIWNSLDPVNVNNKLYNKNLQYYDHYKMFFQTAYTINNSVFVSGSRDRMDFSVGVSDNRQNSNFKGNGDFARTNLTSNVGVELVKNLRLRSITQLVYTKNTQIDPTGRTIMYALNNSRPFADYNYKSPDGNYGAYFGDAVGVNGYNPNYQNQYGDVNDNKTDIFQNFNLNYRFPKFLELDAKYGLNYQTQDIRHTILDQSTNLNAAYWELWLEYYSPFTSYGVPSSPTTTGEINTFSYKTVFQNFISTATVRTDFKNDFHLNIPIRTTTQFAYDYRKNVFNQYITYGVDAPPYTPYTTDQMAQTKVQSDRKTPFVTYGYLVNHRFEFGEFAGISGGFRSDYSSAFGQGSKPFTFPRGDAYVRLSALNFWNNGKLGAILPEFKIRAAYGEAGVQPFAFDRYITLNTRTIGTGNALVYNTSNPNPNLDVENSKELEIGTDLSLNLLKGNWLKNINISATYWDRKTDNAIWDVDAAPSSGTGTIKDNAFGLASHGFQASLNASLLSSKNLNWNFTTLFSKQTSKITSVIGQEVVVTSFAGSTNMVLRAGEKVGQLYGFFGLHSVDQLAPDGTPFIPKDQQQLYTVASNGWVVDKATKQPYFTPTQYSFGDPNPKFNMSFINDVSFKDYVALSMQWDWIHGSHLYNQTKEWMYRDGISGDYDKSITIDGQAGAWTAFYRGVYAQVSRNGTKNYFYEDASFMRLRNISLSLDVAKLVRIPGFQKLQLVLSGRNLVTFTDYTGMDPEINSGTTNSAFDRGVDHDTVPNIKSYQVGLNIGF